MPTLDDDNEATETAAEPADDKPRRKSPPKGSLDNRAPPTIWNHSGADANLLFDEILQAGKEKGLDSSAYKINLKQLTPRQITIGSIPGEAVPTGDALLTYVQNIHMQSRTQGDARYEVMIADRARGTFVSKGFLQLPDRNELAMQLGPPSPYAPPAYGPPPSAFGYAPRAYWPPQPAPQMHQAPQQPQVQQPQAPPAPPPQASQHADPYVAMLIAQNAQLQEKLAYMAGQNERFFAQGGGGFGAAGAVPQAPEVTQQSQQPQAPQYAPPPYMPPGFIAPSSASQPQNLEERVTNSVIDRLLQLGVIQRPAAAVAGAPQTQAPPTPAGAVGQITESLTVVRDFVKQLAAFREVGREMGAVLEPDGLGAAPDEPPEPPKPPPNPEDDLPWKRIHLGPDFKWAIDKETENTSLQGVMAEMLNDEKIRDKVFEVTNKGLDFIREVYRGRPLFQQHGVPQLGAPPGYQPQVGHQTQPPPPNGAGGGWGSRG